MSIQLEVGKTYVSALGQKVKIVRNVGGLYVGDSGSSYYIGGEWARADDRSHARHHLVEEWIEPTLPHADIIRALLDGKQVQQEVHYVSGGYSQYEDLGGTTVDNIRFLLTYSDRKFRIKPEPVVRWLAVFRGVEGMTSPSIHAGEGWSQKASETKEGMLGRLNKHDREVIERNGICLRIELDPETLAVLSATTVPL